MGRCCHARALERSLRRSRVFAITSSAVRPCDSYRRAPVRAEGSLTPCRRRRPCDAVCSFATSTLMKSAILPHRSTTPPGNLFEPSSQPPALSRDEPRLRRRRERSPCPCSAARARSLSTAPFARRSAHSHPPRGPPLPPARRLGEGTEGGDCLGACSSGPHSLSSRVLLGKVPRGVPRGVRTVCASTLASGAHLGLSAGRWSRLCLRGRVDGGEGLAQPRLDLGRSRVISRNLAAPSLASRSLACAAASGSGPAKSRSSPAQSVSSWSDLSAVALPVHGATRREETPPAAVALRAVSLPLTNPVLFSRRVSANLGESRRISASCPRRRASPTPPPRTSATPCTGRAAAPAPCASPLWGGEEPGS